jgi:TPR repeat protein
MHDGWREEAYRLIRQAISEGDMSAQVMLAKMWPDVDMSRAEVDQLIDYIDASMDPTDIWVHLELHGAYDLRMGTIPYEERAPRGFHHLVKACELGAGAINSLAVARIYRSGMLGVDVNRAESIRWYKRAIEQGSVDAGHELQECYAEEKQEKGTVIPLERRRKSKP